MDTVELANTTTTFINDVVITREGAWFTDTLQPRLYLIPIGRGGELGAVQTLQSSGPAADTSGEFNLNGIAATANGSTLLVSHTGNGRLYTVNPATGASAVIDGITLPNVDGILLEAGDSGRCRTSAIRLA